ncbi:hypothetical protein LOTGIDRAFT_159240 [Lottia gigantea]|uniref:Uncharacterized protein n=1 Tax=Lottia gigantea TaxID=225164 RepID=V4C9L0_LOTGI|nr:hypothetical protein LOTGIDRAFT_159240 [Lottia gigantea]ESO98434.1 hypothetical protein LOTGIDRAFT_159240 [Lottia gigantea]
MRKGDKVNHFTPTPRLPPLKFCVRLTTVIGITAGRKQMVPGITFSIHGSIMEWKAVIFIWSLILVIAESKTCLKNEVIGHREGNIYTCDDPLKQRCCEEGTQFTCCEPAFDANLTGQLQLWGTVALMILVMAFIYLYYAKDREVFKRETLQLAIDNFTSKFRKGNKKSFSQLDESVDESKHDSGGIPGLRTDTEKSFLKT